MRDYSGFYKDNIIDFPHSTEYVELRKKAQSRLNNYFDKVTSKYKIDKILSKYVHNFDISTHNVFLTPSKCGDRYQASKCCSEPKNIILSNKTHRLRDETLGVRVFRDSL